MSTPATAMRREYRALAIHAVTALANEARQRRMRLSPERQLEDQDLRKVLNFINETADSRWIEACIDMYPPLIDLNRVDEELRPLELQINRMKMVPRALRDSMLDRVRTARACLLGRDIK